MPSVVAGCVALATLGCSRVDLDAERASILKTDKAWLGATQAKDLERTGAATVWRKGADGSFKCVVDIWNDEPRKPSEPPAKPSATTWLASSH